MGYFCCRLLLGAGPISFFSGMVLLKLVQMGILKSITILVDFDPKSRTTGGPKPQNSRKYVQISKNDENLHLKWNCSPSLARAPMPVHLSKPFGTPLHVGL